MTRKDPEGHPNDEHHAYCWKKTAECAFSTILHEMNAWIRDIQFYQKLFLPDQVSMVL